MQTPKLPDNAPLRSEQEIMENLLSAQYRRTGEDQFFHAYSYFVREAVRKYSIPEEDALDAYSDTIISAIEKITSGVFEGRSSLKTYVYQIFHNKCVDLLRKKSSNKYSIHQTVSITDMLEHISDAAKSVIQRLVEKSDMALLKQRLNELGGNCRQLLMLSSDGYTDKEIALTLEYKSTDVVKSSRKRCIEKLRQLYKIK
jgi:RNA polymerase sigma-70 factor (ECF subfamily)